MKKRKMKTMLIEAAATIIGIHGHEPGSKRVSSTASINALMEATTCSERQAIKLMRQAARLYGREIEWPASSEGACHVCSRSDGSGVETPSVSKVQ